jgi:hypothetical protein
MRRGVGWADQRVEVRVLLEVSHDKRTDWNHDLLVIPGKLKRGPREPRGNASMPEWRRHLSVVEYQATCPVIVIPEHRHAFWKAGLESVGHRVVRDRDYTSRINIVHGSQRSLTLLHHLQLEVFPRATRATGPSQRFFPARLRAAHRFFCAALILARASADMVGWLAAAMTDSVSAALPLAGAPAALRFSAQYFFIRSPTAFLAATDMGLRLRVVASGSDRSTDARC